MPDIALTDAAGLTANVALREDSPLAKAGLTQIVSTLTSLAGSLSQPASQAPVKNVVFGAQFHDASLLVEGAATVGLKASATAQLTLAQVADKMLFGDDAFAPPIAIGAGECWAGFEIDASVDAGLSGSADGFGVGVDGATALKLATYTKLAPGRSLLDGLGDTLSNFQVSCSARAIRNQPAGTVTISDLAGTLTFSGSYTLPVSLNALASADLPLKQTIAINPSVTVQVAGSIALSGDFVVRSYKQSDTQLVLGVYKKKAKTLTAKLTAGAQLQADLGKTDLVAAIMGAVFPAVDPTKEGITGADAAALKPVLQEAVDRNLSVAVNVACSASFTDEAAVVYAIDLGGDEAATDAALGAALHGDWTRLDGLATAKPLRNIVRHTEEFQHKFGINLLGIYNAVSVADFVRSCTMLHDGDGHLVITDRVSASRISAAASPLLADPDKLRRALADAFLATVTYTASKDVTLAASQTYFLYENQLTRQEMKDAVRLGRALGLIGAAEWDDALAANATYRHARVDAAAQYDHAAALKLFLDGGAPRQRADYVRAGRAMMRALIDPGDPAGPERLAILANDAAWSAMDAQGNTAVFRQIPELSGLGPTQLGAVSTDWTDIAWWADSMQKIGPALADVLSGAGDFTKKREKLAGMLAAVTRNTHAAFVGGWGLAVMFALSGGAKATMDIAADGITRHYERG